MESSKLQHRDSFEIGDGLDGVDDFAEESNPFENPFDDTILNDAPPPAYEDRINSEVPTTHDGSTPIESRELRPGLLNYYSQYFQLSTQDLKTNLYESISFKRKLATGDEESSVIVNGPNDLYGAIWVTATVILSKFLVLGLLRLIEEGIFAGWKLSNTEIDTLYLSLIHSVWLFYSYVFGMGVVSYKLLNKADPQITGIETIAIYGYSNTIWIPTAIIIDIVDLFQEDSIRLISLLLKCLFIFCAFVKSSLYLHSKLAREGGENYVRSFIVVNAIFCVLVKFILF